MSKVEFVTQISGDSSALPTWLNRQELQRLITEHNPGTLEIQSIKCRSEQFIKNALSLQIQVKLKENKTQTLNYLVKSTELNKCGILKFPRLPNFQLESFMYHEVLPALEQLYKNVSKPQSFSQRSYRSVKTSNCLYLDNLQVKGYRSVNQPKGLGKNAMEPILSKLAAFHAATARYIQLNPQQLKELTKLGLSKKSDQKITEMRQLLKRKFSESLRSSGLQHFEDKVKTYLKNSTSTSDTLVSNRSFKVIMIGACSPNNILGNFDAFGDVKDAVFSDFSHVSHGPAVFDLFELLLTSPANKTEQFDAHLRYYYDELVDNLKLLKFKGNLPTLTDFQVELLDIGYWGFDVVTEILPLVLADFESPEVEDPFRTPKYAEEIRKLLPWLENRSYFELEPEPINYY